MENQEVKVTEAKASEVRKRTKEVILPPYSQEAANFIASKVVPEYEADKKLGFDVKDRESILNFDFEYTPIGSILLVKCLTNSTLALPNAKNISELAIVVGVGTEINRPIKKGDLVSLSSVVSPSVDGKYRTIKGITLLEVSAFSIGGIYISHSEYQERLKVFKGISDE
jgi:hypothetical protein